MFENCEDRFGVVPNVFTCNILVTSLCKKGDMKGALKVLDEMPGMGFVPNVATYTTVLGAMFSMGKK
ncbi:hypothetical protein Dimus_021116, partial [Dionaea muscipula]